jgi:hypothetical protein
MATTNNTPTFTLTLTFSELRAISDLIRERYLQTSYYVNLTDEEVADDVKPGDDGEEIVVNNQWKRTQRDTDRAKRAQLEALHQRLMGGPIPD